MTTAAKPKEQDSLRIPFDRRDFPRVAIDIPTELELQGMGQLSSVSRDLSVGGMCVSTQSRFILDSVRSVTVELPHKRLTLKGEGRWQREIEGDQTILTGIQFAELTRPVLYDLWDLVHETAKHITTFLSTSSDLQTFPLSELMEIAHATRYRSIPSGGYIYRQEKLSSGDDSIFIILEGTVVLETRSKRGRRVELCRLGPGRLFGGTPLVTRSSHRESAVACCDAGLLDISHGVFEELKRQRTDLALRLSSAVVESHASRLHDSLLNMAEIR